MIRQTQSPGFRGAARTYHVMPTRDGRWEVRAMGEDKALAAFNDQDDACAYADGLAFGLVIDPGRTQRS